MDCWGQNSKVFNDSKWQERAQSLPHFKFRMTLTKTRNQIFSQNEWSCVYFAGPVRRCIIQRHSPADRVQTWRIVNCETDNLQLLVALKPIAPEVRVSIGTNIRSLKSRSCSALLLLLRLFPDWFPWTAMLPGHCSRRQLCFQSAAVAAQHHTSVVAAHFN